MTRQAVTQHWDVSGWRTSSSRSVGAEDIGANRHSCILDECGRDRGGLAAVLSTLTLLLETGHVLPSTSSTMP